MSIFELESFSPGKKCQFQTNSAYVLLVVKNDFQNLGLKGNVEMIDRDMAKLHNLK